MQTPYTILHCLQVSTKRSSRFDPGSLLLLDLPLVVYMTEIGHGSDVSRVETTATYDHSSREFILNSPAPSSTKFWIGALAKTANMAVVFAQLLVNDTNVGVHVFLVQIRDYDTHKPLPGIIIGDC